MRVLICEDEPRVAAALARGLRRHGAAVDVAADGAQALYRARVHAYDVVVLDRDMPEIHGDVVCRTLNSEQPDTKILMLTAARGTDALVEGLRLGADDYMGKPFAFEELLARVHALARRAGLARPAVLPPPTPPAEPPPAPAEPPPAPPSARTASRSMMSEQPASDSAAATSARFITRSPEARWPRSPRRAR